MIKEMNIVKKFIRNLTLMTISHFDIKPAQRNRFFLSFLTTVTLQGLFNGGLFYQMHYQPLPPPLSSCNDCFQAGKTKIGGGQITIAMTATSHQHQPPAISHHITIIHNVLQSTP